MDKCLEKSKIPSVKTLIRYKCINKTFLVSIGLSYYRLRSLLIYPKLYNKENGNCQLFLFEITHMMQQPKIQI